MNQTMIEYLSDLWKFFNRREVPANKLISLLGRQRPSAIPTGAVLFPHEKRVSQIVVRYDMRKPDWIKLISFDHKDNPIGLDELTKAFGHFVAEYDEVDNATMLTCSGFPEGDILERVAHRIEGYQFKNCDKEGLMLVQPEGETFVPFADLQMPTTAFFFKEFERPVDPNAKTKPTGNLINRR